MKLLLVQVRYGMGDIILAGLPYIHALSKKFNSKINFKNKKYPYFISWIISTFVGPIISFFKNNMLSNDWIILFKLNSFRM